MIKYFAVFLIPMGYFLALWLIPWQEIYSIGSIPSSILFDIAFVIMGFYLYKIKYFIGKIDYKKLVLQLALTIVFAVLCIGISVGLKLNSPFRFLDLIFLKLLIMAPLLEELVFRGVFVEVGERAKLNPKVSLLFNPILFSISHAPALWYVGAEFHGFIGFQLLYTLGLGYLCTQARLKTKGVLAPVILHLAFNLVFYVAIIWKFI